MDDCMTIYPLRMTMLSFRLDDEEFAALQRWADDLGVHRSTLLRDAVRLHLNRLSSEQDAERWAELPLTDGELALAAIADWGPADDWKDWADATDADPSR
jgi:predicted transcriptional regulator